MQSKSPFAVKYAWMHGKFAPFSKAKIPLLTHSFHYGSAAFEGIRFYDTEMGPAIFRLPDHLDRLFLSARTLGMRVPFSKKEMQNAMRTLIKKNGLRSGYIRPIVYYGEKMGLFPKEAPVCAAIACWPWGKYLAKDTVRVRISSLQRIQPGAGEARAKIFGTYFNSVLATLEAHREGNDEALLLDCQGNIAEGPGENIFFVRAKTLVTPREGSILPGITRDSVMTFARDLGYRVYERDIKPAVLRSFDEAFFTGTAAEVNAVGAIGRIRFSGGKEGKTTREIRKRFQKATRGKVGRYRKWLTYV